MPKFEVEGLPEVYLKEGDKLLVENEKSDDVYILKSGGVTITTGGSEICRINEPMSIFGEISSLCGCPHTATVIVTESSRFYKIENLRKYLEEHNAAGVELAEILAHRLVNMNSKFLEFKSTLDSTFNSDSTLKDQFNNLILCVDSILGRSIFDRKKK